jgi:hypothetical protein
MAGWLLLHVVRGTSTSEKKHNLPQTLSELVISSSRERKREREREREKGEKRIVAELYSRNQFRNSGDFLTFPLFLLSACVALFSPATYSYNIESSPGETDLRHAN